MFAFDMANSMAKIIKYMKLSVRLNLFNKIFLSAICHLSALSL